MPDRNINRTLYRNTNKLYREEFEKKGVKEIYHYGKLRLNSISVEDRKELSPISHIWQRGDRLYKLSLKYYGTSDYWWIIGWYNKKPLDFMYSAGQTIYVPLPLEDAVYLAERDEE